MVSFTTTLAKCLYHATVSKGFTELHARALTADNPQDWNPLVYPTERAYAAGLARHFSQGDAKAEQDFIREMAVSKCDGLIEKVTRKLYGRDDDEMVTEIAGILYHRNTRADKDGVTDVEKTVQEIADRLAFVNEYMKEPVLAK